MENEGKEGTARSSKWNPTKDQITVLENLYKQGIRTPSADQIQQIARGLRVYGHIECKNVFYWFQNHKARHRQKLKQEGIAYFNRLLHKTSRFSYPPPSSNGDNHNRHGSVYTKDLHRGNVMMIPGGGYEKQTATDHKIQLPDITTSTTLSLSSSSQRFDRSALRDYCYNDEAIDAKSSGRETLPLFPLQPLSATNDDGVRISSFDHGTDTPVVGFGDGGGREQPFIDFFSGGSSRFDNSGNAK